MQPKCLLQSLTHSMYFWVDGLNLWDKRTNETYEVKKKIRQNLLHNCNWKCKCAQEGMSVWKKTRQLSTPITDLGIVGDFTFFFIVFQMVWLFLGVQVSHQGKKEEKRWSLEPAWAADGLECDSVAATWVPGGGVTPTVDRHWFLEIPTPHTLVGVAGDVLLYTGLEFSCH